MKSLIAITFLFATIISTKSFAQTTNSKDKTRLAVDYKFAAVFYPFAAIADNFKIGGEYKPNEEIGLRGIVTYGYGEDNIIYGGDEYSSVGGELQLRYYPTPGNPLLFTGFYALMNNISTNHFTTVYDPLTYMDSTYSKNYDANTFSFGVLGGFQGTIAKRFLFDAYLGIGPNIPSGHYKEEDQYGQTTYRIPFIRRGMKFTVGINGGVILFK